jgi:hypothetical protein
MTITIERITDHTGIAKCWDWMVLRDNRIVRRCLTRADAEKDVRDLLNPEPRRTPADNGRLF